MAISREVKVGAFVLLGMLAAGIVVFLIGDERSLFSRSDDYQVVVDDVEGLKRGGMVRMGGIDVGSVTGIRYSEDSNDPRLHVTVTVTRDEARRIRQDSVASIEAKGLLGDKMVDITVGSSDKPKLPAGSTIPSRVSDMSQIMSRVGKTAQRVEKVLVNLEGATNTMASEKFRGDLGQAVSSLSNILKEVDQGDGYLARLVRDPEEADRLSRTMESLAQSADKLEHTIEGVNAIIGRVNHGPGFAHEVIYGDAPTETLTQFGSAAEEVALTLRGVREGDGLAHSLLYGGDETDDMMGNMTAISNDLRHIVADVREGKGTIGALLVDPSVYEDIKVILGNVQRNRTLRALVRYSIKRDETMPGVDDRARTPAGAAGRNQGPGSSTGPASSAAP